MTTEAGDQAQAADMPLWFQAFVEENARQHQELGERVSGIAIGLNGKIGRCSGRPQWQARHAAEPNLSALVELLGAF